MCAAWSGPGSSQLLGRETPSRGRDGLKHTAEERPTPAFAVAMEAAEWVVWSRAGMQSPADKHRATRHGVGKTVKRAEPIKEHQARRG